jgi:transcriptional regulator with XRE-family HTH domain
MRNDYKTFGDFLSDKRKRREIPSFEMSEIAGISPGYYCDIEKNRKTPPDSVLSEQVIAALRLTAEETDLFYDLAGQARSGVSPDLPDYIMSHDEVRFALRVAKETATADDWKQFADRLERKRGKPHA